MGRQLLGISAVVLGGCVLEPVELDGRACPCVSGWVCDPSTETCRRSAQETSGGVGSSGTTGSEPPASTSAADPTTTASAESSTGTPPGRFDVQAFSADWSTPESIHWTWDVVGEEGDFLAWELRVATDQAGLDAGEGVMVFDDSTNPELGRFVLKNTAGVDPVVAAVTRGLTPSTEYVARLLVYDTAGGVSQSPNVAIRRTTEPPTQSVVLFADDPWSAGYPLPGCMERTDVAPFEGSHHQEVQIWCDGAGDPSCTLLEETSAECWENLRFEEMGESLSGLGGGDLADAFLEFSLAVIAPEGVEGHGWWSSAGVRIDGMPREYKPLTFPADGTYHRFQVPLTQMNITLDDLAGPLGGPRVGSRWQHGTVLRLDEVRVRW